MRVDCHVHLDPIGPPHRTPLPTTEEVQDYVARDRIDLLGGIYERDETLHRLRDAGIRIFPFFWERNPLKPRIPESARGLKLHPYIERYVLGPDTVGPAMAVARERNLPVLIHSDDREPYLSRGQNFARLAEAFPDIPVIIAHSGSYAPQALDDPDRCLIDEDLVRELVTEAIEVAKQHQNLYLEVCIVANPVKAELIARQAPLNRVLLGSDFPISKESFGSLVFQENALRRAGLSNQQILGLHENARQLLGPRLT